MSHIIRQTQDRDTTVSLSFVNKDCEIMSRTKRREFQEQREFEIIRDIGEVYSKFVNSQGDIRYRNFMLFVCRLVKYKYFLKTSPTFRSKLCLRFPIFHPGFVKNSDSIVNLYDFFREHVNPDEDECAFMRSVLFKLVKSRELKSVWPQI